MLLLQKLATTVAETTSQANGLSDLSFEPARVLEMLPRMGIGMLVIFVVIGIIVLATVAINKIFANKGE